MRDVPIEMILSVSHTAASEWARVHAAASFDPLEFGRKIGQAYLSCAATLECAGDEAATAASLAALSVRPEVLQALALLASLARPDSQCPSQTSPAGAL